MSLLLIKRQFLQTDWLTFPCLAFSTTTSWARRNNDTYKSSIFEFPENALESISSIPRSSRSLQTPHHFNKHVSGFRWLKKVWNQALGQNRPACLDCHLYKLTCPFECNCCKKQGSFSRYWLHRCNIRSLLRLPRPASSPEGAREHHHASKTRSRNSYPSFSLCRSQCYVQMTPKKVPFLLLVEKRHFPARRDAEAVCNSITYNNKETLRSTFIHVHNWRRATRHHAPYGAHIIFKHHDMLIFSKMRTLECRGRTRGKSAP